MRGSPAHLQRHGGPTVTVPVIRVPGAPLPSTLTNAEAELSIPEAAWGGGGPLTLCPGWAGASAASMWGGGPGRGRSLRRAANASEKPSPPALCLPTEVPVS